MNDTERDYAEEMDAAMIPYRENMTKIFEKGWNVDNVVEYIKDHGASVVMEDDNTISLFTGLEEAPDGSLWADDDE